MIQAVAEVNQQSRNLRMIQSIKRKRNHLYTTRAPRSLFHLTVVLVEIANFCVAVPILQTLVVPWIRYVQKAPVKFSSHVSFQIFARHPDNRVRSRSVGHFERLEVELFAFGALAQQLPVVPCVVARHDRLLLKEVS